MKDKPEQISIKLDPALRAQLERQAEAEHRSVSGQARHIIASALEARQHQAA
ncbi:ribbon-helix-helix domain-containing protein [Bradyrhizobium sp. SZCCHNR1045]|uniref:ribbon-helix-helix domain-containing protein n=1 Tax=Bradyrhizobium sp. SZCCHNR1045 TaxID=3057353 RepID=UPI002916DA14|nr:hypothetical protein [Bradyrhizobium sp. SZCCHNR1045]